MTSLESATFQAVPACSGFVDYPDGLRGLAAIRSTDFKAYIHVLRLRSVSDISIQKILPNEGHYLRHVAFRDSDFSFFCC